MQAPAHTTISRDYVKLIHPLLSAIFIALLSTQALQANGVIAGSSAANVPGVDPGSLLMGELNCTACHLAQGKVQQHIIPRPSPKLGRGGMPLTPQGIRAFLMDPDKEKPGTTMPDLLHATPDREGTVDLLVHFLYSQQTKPESKPVGANDFLIAKGKRLYHEIGCVGCHAPQEPAEIALSLEGDDDETSDGADILKRLQSRSIPFSNLARKTTVAAMTDFLLDPLKSRPSGRMPSMNLTRDEATAIAVYLLRDQVGLDDPNDPTARVAGLQYHYFEHNIDSAAKMDDLTPHSSGISPQFRSDQRKRNEHMGFRFTGAISLPTDGEYTFFLNSDDGSILWINGKEVVNHDGSHGASERSGKIKLSAGDHGIRVTYYNAGGPHAFQVSYEGPGIKKQEIPANVLTHIGKPMIPLGSESFTVDPAKAFQGRNAFVNLGCMACHEISGRAPVPTRVRPLHHVNPTGAGGCLNSPMAGRPKYNLSDAQHASIVKTLQGQFQTAVTEEGKLNQNLAALNCYACHSRDGLGGPDADRSHYFKTVGELDLGDEGKTPPHLTGAGAKLRADWFEKLLTGDNKVRPYMATRMPHFGEKNIGHLPELFAKVDLKSDRPENTSMEDAKFGRKLTGTGGLSCVACHTYGEYPSLGIPAMDLTVMTKRLRQDWFYRYLRNPASLRPGTRMPSFWPEGTAANTDILGGNTDRQIHSIWAFLSQGGKSLPPGLIQGKEEIAADTEAVIYRHFITGAGSRAIGVGYPEKANLAFDANNIRLALIWQGAFIDAAKHRAGRGAGSEKPLGYNVIDMPPGAPFAILDSQESAWPSATGREANYRMRGYQLDEQRRPAFLYSYDGIEIKDYPVDLAGDLDGLLSRQFTLTTKRNVDNLWFRAWIGSSVVDKGNNNYLVDEKLTLTFKGTGKPIIRTEGKRSELLVPIKFNNGSASFTEDLTW